MHIELFVEDDLVADVIVRSHTEKRLQTTCFRGMSARCAGNFVLWTSPVEIFRNDVVSQDVLAEIRERWQRREFGTGSLSIDCADVVGWESTDFLSKYDPHVLEYFEPNRKSNGLRVKLSCEEIKAPVTEKLTLVFEFKDENNEPVMVIHSMYPGTDIGELEGDVTAREGRVFFDFNHPGA